MPTAETDEVINENVAVDPKEDVEVKEDFIETKDDDASINSCPTPQDETNPAAKEDPQDAAVVPVAITAPATHPNIPPAGYYEANIIHHNVGVHEPKKKKRQYIKKIPNRPKRPLSAYNVFFKYERERLVRETMLKDNVDKEKVEELIAIRDKTKTGKRVHRKTHGAIPFAELGKQIASNWKSLSASERKKYEEEANADKERYAREMEENNKIMAASDIGGPPIRKRGDNAGGGGKRGQHNSYYEEEQPMNIGPPTPYYDPYFGGYGRPPPPPGAIGGEGYGHPGYPSGPPPPPGPYHYYPPPPHEYAPPYHPYYAYPPRPPPGVNPMQQANPEDPPHSPQRWMPPPPQHGVIGGNNQNPQAECAYQCEICNEAVFSTFKECAEHEKECAKRHNEKDDGNDASGGEEVPDEVDPDAEDEKTSVVLTEKETNDGGTCDPEE